MLEKFNPSFNHNCIHDKVSQHLAYLQPHHPAPATEYSRAASNTNLKANNNPVTRHPIRIIFNTTFLRSPEPNTCYSVGQMIGNYQCTARDVLTPELATLIENTLLPHISTTYGSILEVNSTEYTNITFKGTCSGEGYSMDVRGFTGDYMMYVTSHPTSSPNTIAYSTACGIRGSSPYSPYLGLINFAPSWFSLFANATYLQTHQANWNYLFQVALHEATHALGFSAYMYSRFVDRTTGQVYNTTQVQVTTDGTSPSGQAYSTKRAFLSTPAVRAFARQHTGCDTLPGGELENLGASGFTAGSHWKASRIGEELMLGYAQTVAPLTNMTISLLVDSGWYTVYNATGISRYLFGLDKGCDFAMKPCSAQTWNYTGYWQPSNPQLGSYNISCSATRAAVGISAIIEYNGVLDPSVQHFSKPTVGSFNGYIFDYCLFNSAEGAAAGYFCFDTSRKPSQDGETFGPNSACFLSNSNGSASVNTPACRPQRCNNGVIEFQYQARWYGCPMGQMVNASGLVVQCPNERLCLPGRGGNDISMSLSLQQHMSPLIILFLLSMSVLMVLIQQQNY
ncbi:hypothetical protein SAMD00019534_011960 [Acytostelium subglobosum LB1]|uniref:hypothetical protein n=1 Tax=Acytostelium subglobosum LB1 TaxID=1410327 RepID=UPI000644E856|nr:hypothetical protein SAMD00019534_011960 [Acytostelium subglobosum LB1]GAM18021.1 hypothetical protein SAMD00019534_011960 [Acytostelium subglobosum LB1]|eukprot:XP_012758617.1 hypothetical protein SAMD00019534_011960 [Acytostelium subglobosum LB1]